MIVAYDRVAIEKGAVMISTGLERLRKTLVMIAGNLSYIRRAHCLSASSKRHYEQL
jgi:hypothetical protein